MSKKTKSTKFSKRGKKQVEVVMKEFASGRLRDPHGHKISSRKQAVAVALSEARAAESRGVTRRKFKGRVRLRPKKKHHSAANGSWLDERIGRLL